MNNLKNQGGPRGFLKLSFWVTFVWLLFNAVLDITLPNPYIMHLNHVVRLFRVAMSLWFAWTVYTLGMLGRGR